MREYLTILLVGLGLSLAGTVLAVQAAEAAIVTGRVHAAPAVVSEGTPVTPATPKSTCRPKWPYIVLSCTA